MDVVFEIVFETLFKHGPRECWRFIRRMTVGEPQERGGTEVKLNAGETPVTEKKDENHG